MKIIGGFFLFGALVIGQLVFPSFVFAQSTPQEETSEQERLETIASLLKIIVELQRQLAELQSAQRVSIHTSCAQVELEWGRVSGADSYHLFRDGERVYEGRERRFHDTGLVPGQRYEYVVRAENEGGLGEASETRSVVAPDRCPPQTAPVVTASEASSCGGHGLISWNRVSGAESYSVFKSNTIIYNGTSTRVIDMTGRPGRTYSYTVQATNRGGKGPVSESVRAKVSHACPPPVPEAPDDLEVVTDEDINTEALVSVSLTSPGDGTVVREGQSFRRVFGASVRSDLAPSTIERADISWEGEPWRYFEEIRVQVGRTSETFTDLSRDDFISSGNDIYRLRISGLTEEIREGRTATISVRVSGKEVIGSELPRTFRVFLETGAVRVVDQAGISHRVPSSGGESFSRTFSVQE